MNGILLPKEVAKILKVCEETIRRKLQTGKLKGFKIGNDWRVREQDLQEFITSAEVAHPISNAKKQSER